MITTVSIIGSVGLLSFYGGLAALSCWFLYSHFMESIKWGVVTKDRRIS